MKSKEKSSIRLTNLRNELNLTKKKFALYVKEIRLEMIKTKQFTQHLFFQQEEDRRQISRDLHDEVGQILMAINFELSILSKEAFNSNQALRDKIAFTQSLVKQSVELIHEYAKDLRPMVLDDLGLLPALNSYIKDFTIRTKIPVKLETYSRISELEDFHKTILFRVAQECLTNISKHSKATKASIKINKSKDIVSMDIQDNGISFNYKKIQANKNYKRIGLIGMEERLKIADGRMVVSTPKKGGTKIHSEISVLSKNDKYKSKSKKVKK